MRCLLAALVIVTGCAKVLGFEQPVLDSGPTPVMREPCFATDEIERAVCEGDSARSRICTPQGWSSWSAGAKPGWRSMARAPIKGRIWHSAVWTGDELIVWGGRGPEEAFNDGAAYDPVHDTWRVLAPAPLSPRIDHTAVWTGKEMFVWGGRIDGAPSTTYFSDGATYDPRTNTWQRLPGSPMANRARVGAVLATTTREVLLWGGIYEFDFTSKDGAAFDPETRKWTYLSTTTANPRAAPATYWDGTRLVRVGGECKGFDSKPCNDVWAYEPAGGIWERLAGFPASYAPDQGYASASRKAQMLLFGGEKTTTKYGNGVIFDAASKSFAEIPAPVSELGPKAARTFATAFWADGKVWIYGGFIAGGSFDDHGATFDVESKTWAVMPAVDLGPRMAASATSSHDDTFVWGGRRDATPPDFFAHLDDGRILRHTP